ncbi:MAG: hypothetical protein KA765_09290 [Thermoflexales bacterium]|nr:hypothetical protein [Thermoflexales bacterium]
MSQVTSSPAIQSESTGRSWAALPLGLGLGVVAMIIGAVLWGGIAYFTDTVYFIIPLGVGFAVASALLLPFKQKSFFLAVVMFVPSAVLTIASALLGDYIYYTLVYAREATMAIPASAALIAQNFVAIATESPDTAQSIGLAAVGALLGLINAARS